MIASIIMIVLAFWWLMIETDWMRVRLVIGESMADYDKKIMAQLYKDYRGSEQQASDLSYNEWLKKRYEPALVRLQDTQIDYPQDRWMTVEEDLTKRRNGEMLYQRGAVKYYDK